MNNEKLTLVCFFVTSFVTSFQIHDDVRSDMQRIEKIQEVQARENSHQCLIMFYTSLMFDETGELAYFRKQTFGIFYNSSCYMSSLC